MTFLPPVRECIDRFARCLVTVTDDATFSKRQQQHIVSHELVPSLVDLNKQIESCPGRCPIRFHHPSNKVFALEEDDLICLGLGDWEAALERVLLHDRAAMMSALSSVVAAARSSKQHQQQVSLNEQDVLSAAKIAVLGNTRASNGASAPDGNLAKASRRHQRRVESIIPSSQQQQQQQQQHVNNTSLSMQSQLRSIEAIVLMILLSSCASPPSPPPISAVELLCSSALLSLVPESILTAAQRADLVRKMPWNAARDSQLLSKIPPKRIAVLQRFARRVIALRRCRLARQQRAQKTQPIFNSIALRFLNQQPQQQQQAHVVRRVAETELRGAELQDYLDNEEPRFKDEWRQYEAGLKQFYMNECELDPQVWKAVGVKDDATGEVQARFLDLRSGKLQTEHPHKDKIFQIKQRQWLAATRARSATLARATTDLETLQKSAVAGGALANEMAQLRRGIVASGLREEFLGVAKKKM